MLKQVGAAANFQSLRGVNSKRLSPGRKIESEKNAAAPWFGIELGVLDPPWCG